MWRALLPRRFRELRSREIYDSQHIFWGLNLTDWQHTSDLLGMDEVVFLKPPPYGTISNWLGPEMLQRLWGFAHKHRDNFGPSPSIRAGTRRSDEITDLGDLAIELRTRVRAVLPIICQRLGIAAFTPGRIEVEMVVHGDGAFFSEHRDTYLDRDTATDNEPAGRKLVSHLIVSTVYYFHRFPKAFSGGVLRLYPAIGSKHSNSFVDIEPTNDMLVFFPSFFPHEVLPVVCPSGRFEDSRFALNLLVHRRTLDNT